MSKLAIWSIVVSLLVVLGLSPAAMADVCAIVDPNASLPRPGEVNYERRLKSYGNKCMLEDKDRGQMDYYTKSEARCNAIPGFIHWEKDQGSGHNLCVFEPPSDNPTERASNGENDNPTDSNGGETASAPSRAPENRRQKTVDHGNYTIEFCNKSKGKLFLALALYDQPEDDSWTVQGWWKFSKGECKKFSRRLGKYASHKIGFYAESKKGFFKKDYVWGGSSNLCVHSDAFNRRNVENYTCSTSERLVGFESREVKRGTQIQNLK